MIDEIRSSRRRTTVFLISSALLLAMAFAPRFGLSDAGIVAVGGVTVSWLTFWLGYRSGYRAADPDRSR